MAALEPWGFESLYPHQPTREAMEGVSAKEKQKEKLYIELEVTIDKALLQSSFNQKLADLQPQVKMRGFRKGKVPLKLVAEMHGERVWNDFIEGFLNHTNSSIMNQREIQRAGPSKLNIKHCSLEEGAQYTLATSIMPEIAPVDLSGIAPLKKPIIKDKISKVEVDEKLKSICKRRKRIRPVQGRKTIKEGDIIVAHIEARIHGGGKTVIRPTKNSALELTEEVELMPSFNSHLIGKKTGEHKFTLSLPSDYGPNPEMAGKKVDFFVQVKEIREAYQYEPDDALAKELGLNSLEELKKALIPEIEQEREEKSQIVLRRNAILALWRTQKIDAPPKMVEEEMIQIRSDEPGGSISQKEIAEYRVQTGLLLKDFADRYGVRVSEEELDQAIRDNTRFRKIDPNQVAAWLFEQKSLRALISKCKVEEIPVSLAQFKEIENQDLGSLKGGKSKGEQTNKKSKPKKIPAKKAKKEGTK